MTRQETAKIITVLRSVYPQAFKGMTGQDVQIMVDTWNVLFEDYSYQQANAGLRVFLSGDTKGFLPAPGQIIDCIEKVEHPATAEMSEAEAWVLVYNTMTGMGWDKVDEAYNSLPEACRRAIGSPGRLREMAMEQDAAAQLSDRARFQDNYRNVRARMRDEAKIPKRIRIAMAERKMIDA